MYVWVAITSLQRCGIHHLPAPKAIREVRPGYEAFIPAVVVPDNTHTHTHTHTQKRTSILTDMHTHTHTHTLTLTSKLRNTEQAGLEFR